MIDKLFALVPWYYRWLAFVALIAACMGYGYVKGAESRDDEIAEIRKGIDVERTAVITRQAERKRLSDALIAQKDQQRENDLRSAHQWWAAYVQRLQSDRDGGPGGGAQPVREPAPVCDDPARSAELQGAFESARRAAGAALADYRAGVADLLRAAEVQTGDLIDLQEWAQHEQLLNAQP